MKRTILSAAFAAGFLGAAGAASAEAIKVAFIDPLSGPFAATGQAGLN